MSSSGLKSNDLSIPSKTFLFGEYAILKGSPAFVLAHAPYFRVKTSNKNFELHRNSPAGTFLRKHNLETKISLLDPHNKKGGFGRSTAEFLSAVSLVDNKLSVEEIFEEYLKVFSNNGSKPSGADLIAQASSSSVLVSKQPYSCTKFDWPFKEVSILICHTNNKIDTHEHLSKDLSLLDFSKLEGISESLSESLKMRDFDVFLKHLKNFSTEQRSLGLIHENTLKVTQSLNKKDDVIFSRGCGALGADVVAILVERSFEISSLSSSFKELNLDLVCTI